MARPVKRRSKGAVFLVSMVTMTVMFIIGTMYLRWAANNYFQAERNLRKAHAMAAATAGLNYVIWREKYSTDQIPSNRIYDDTIDVRDAKFTSDYTPTMEFSPDNAPEDKTQVWVADFTVPGAANAVGYQAISQGEYRNYTCALRATFSKPHDSQSTSSLFEYAVFSMKNYDQKGPGGLIEGRLGSNGDVKIHKVKAMEITDGINAAKKVELGERVVVDQLTEYGTKYRVHKKSQAVLSHTGHVDDYPPLDLAKYRQAAQENGQIINGNLNLRGDVPEYQGVVYVRGKIDITGDVSFMPGVTLVAEKEINIRGKVKQVGDEGYASVALISGRAIKVSSKVSTLYAAMFVHSPDKKGNYWRPKGKITVSGDTTIYGSVVGDEIKVKKLFNVHHKDPSSTIILPGNDAWSLISWERVW